MTRDEIIKMAAEACDPNTVCARDGGWWTLKQEELERFAALVAAAERKRITQAAMLAAEKAVDAAIALEREACAKVCGEMYRRDGFALAECQAADECAAAIRARSAK